MTDERIGIRLEIDAETGKVRLVSQEMARLGRAVDRAGKQAKRAKGRFSRLFSGVHGQLAKYGLIAGGFTAIGASLRSMVGHAVRSGVAMERWESRLRSATGSNEGMRRELAYLRGEAERLGLAFSALVDDYSLFAASTKGTALEGKRTREIFTSVTEAAAVMRLSVEDTQGVMRALTQIVSKGVVSAEELRQQLGDRLPGAYQAAAAGMGLTTKALSEQLAQGKLMSQEFLPAFARALRETYGAEVPAAADSAVASFGRLRTAIDELGIAVSQSGLLDWVAGLADGAAEAAKALTGALAPAQADLSEAGIQRRLARARSRVRGGGNQRVSDEEVEAHPDVIRLRSLLTPESRSQALSNVQSRLSRLAQRRLALADATAGSRYAARVDIDDEISGLRAWQTELLTVGAMRQGLAEQLQRGSPTPAAPITASPSTSEAGQQLLEQYRRRALGPLSHVQRARLDVEDARVTGQTREEILSIAAGLDADAHMARVGRRLERANDTVRAQFAAEDAEREKMAADAALARADAARAATERWGAAVTETRLATELLAAAQGELSEGERAAILGEARRRDEAQALRESKRAIDGATRALRDFVDYGADAAANVEEVMVRAFEGAENALTDFVLRGKASFSDLIESLIADLARLTVRQFILAPLADTLAGGFGGRGAPELNRSHLTPGNAGNLAPGNAGNLAGNVRVEVVNNGSAPQRVESAAVRVEPDQLVVGIVMDDLDRGGPIGRRIGQTFGLRRAV